MRIDPDLWNTNTGGMPQHASLQQHLTSPQQNSQSATKFTIRNKIHNPQTKFTICNKIHRDNMHDGMHQQEISTTLTGQTTQFCKFITTTALDQSTTKLAIRIKIHSPQHNSQPATNFARTTCFSACINRNHHNVDWSDHATANHSITHTELNQPSTKFTWTICYTQSLE